MSSSASDGGYTPPASLATTFVHAGQPADPHSGAVMTPITLASTFQQPSPGVFAPGGFEYSRSDNPTRRAYEELVAKSEGGEFGLAFASGSAATGTILHLLGVGDHCLSMDDVYGGTNRYFRRIANAMHGIVFDFVDFTDLDKLRAALHACKTPDGKPNPPKLVWVETPTNPTLKVVDIAAVCEAAHAVGALVAVDNTFLSPYFQQPLRLGADIVVNSVSKYMNGHSDVIGGVVATNSREVYDKLKFVQNGLGAIPAPFDCYMVMRGMKTLHLRMEQHQKNAFAVANFLEGHDQVERVAYPGLESHPQHAIAKKQQSGYGGMITFWIKGGLDASRKFLEGLKLFKLAESLGGVESLAEHPAIMTHASVPAEQRAELGINDGLIRLSCGVETTDDVVADVKAALEAASK